MKYGFMAWYHRAAGQVKRARNVGDWQKVVLKWHDPLIAHIFLPLIPNSVTPNMFTVIRFLMVPIVVWCVYRELYVIAFPLFLIAALTDVIDGTLARTRRMITKWGVICDPLADKLLVGGAGLIIVARFLSPVLALSIVVVESVFVCGGMWYARRGVIIPANVWGKTKMFLQVMGITFVFIGIVFSAQFFFVGAWWILGASFVFAGVSMLTRGV